MRSIFIVLIAAVLAACSSSTAPAPPIMQTGTLYFTIGAACVGTHSTAFEIDSTEVGPETLAPGATSKGYVTTEGNHGVQARIMGYVNGAHALWTQDTRVTVSANGSYTHLVAC